MSTSKINISSLNVFLIEDDKNVRELINEALNREGYNVIAFETADEAITEIKTAVLHKKRIDIVLLDMLLTTSKMSGEDLLNYLLKFRYPIEIIIISGQISSNDFHRLVLKGASNFLQKPFQLQELLMKIREHAQIGAKKYQYFLQPWHRTTRTDRHVFLSYCTENRDLALGLKKILENSDITVWYADIDILPGDPWRDLLIQALNNCPVFLILLTREALNSDNVRAELERAIARKKREKDNYLIVPILYDIEASDLPNHLQRIQYIDISNMDRLSDQIQTLCFSIEKFLHHTFRL